MNIKNNKGSFKKRPIGFPKLDDFEIKSETNSEINYGEILIKVLWLSLDPYMRGRMSEAKSYASPIKIGECNNRRSSRKSSNQVNVQTLKKVTL